MWICQKCYHKNSSSSHKCHGPNCNEKRPGSDDKITKAKDVKKLLYQVEDYCPKCMKHRIFKRSNLKKNYWSCTVCHKKFKLIGDPTPKTDTHIKEIVS